MPKLDRKVWWGLKRDLQNYALGIAEQSLTVVEIPRSEGELGYTSKGNSIHLANDHPIMDAMTTKEKIAFITGVFGHELMHKIATHFQELERVRNAFASKYEAEIFWEIANVVEDPSIESQAKYYFGGWLLKCLHRSITVLFRESPPMGDEPMHPFSQFITALIMYGDGGAIKGEFQDKQAKQIFYEVLPTVEQCIEERDSKKRVHLQYEIFLKAKPLWEKIVKNREKMEELMNELSKIMKGCGKDNASSGGTPLEIDGDDTAKDPLGEKKKRRRKITFRKVSKEELEEMRKNGSEGEDDGESDIEVLYTDDNTSEEKQDSDPSRGSGASAGDSPDNNEAGHKKPSEPTETKGEPPECTSEEFPRKSDEEESECGEKSESSSENGNNSEGCESDANDTPNGSGTETEKPKDKGDSKSKSSEKCDIDVSQSVDGMDEGYSEPDYEKESAIDDSEYELSESDLNRIEGMIAEYRADFERQENESSDCHSEDLNAPAVAADYSGARCLNKRITCSNPDSLEPAYIRHVDTIADGINFLYNQMKRIINNDSAEREYRGTGKLNVGRLNCGRMTSRVFDRNIDPANKADMCVEILVDESGSMSSGRNWQCAMMCCIGLAEVLAKLRIPTKVIGFTADNDSGYDVTHHHYMHWLNTKNERMNLMNISAHSNNFDGYSIRYATEMIRRRKEQHKILIIISDGAPACNYYFHKNGIIDTTDAVKQAAKKVDVIGVGIGGRDTSIWRTMYGSAFIHVKDAKDLLTNIGKEIQNIMRRW